MASTHKDTAVSFLKMVASGDVRNAFARHAAPGFRHHNPFFKGDAASLADAMEDNARQHPDKILDVQAAIEEQDRVAVFSRVRRHPQDRGAALVHIFRFEGARIAELWDIGQPVPETPVNENGMF